MSDIRKFFVPIKPKEEKEKVNKMNTIHNFSDNQMKAYELYKNNCNLFITGPGGCGKSYFIKKVYEDAIENKKQICVTAMTGCAAILLDCNATTINTWGSLGIGEDDYDKIIKKIRLYKKKDNWLKTEILIIDEVSMMSQYTFEMIDYIARKLRKNEKPFGGIQVIFSGDFYQLPPVFNKLTETQQKKAFCFESPLWNETFKNYIIFNENFRQNKDKKYENILNEIRNNNISIDNIEILLNCTKRNCDIQNTPTLLYPTKKMVDNYNNKEFNKLNNNEINSYRPCIYKYNNKTKKYDLLEKDTKANNTIKTKQIKYYMLDDELKLCVGCKVMVTANINFERKLVNGTQGIIIDFIDGNPLIEIDNNQRELIEPYTWKSHDEQFKIEQIPLILSWAITIHKSQGITLDKVRVNLGSSVFEYGQSYVALSRVKSLDGLFLDSINFQKIKTNPKVVKFYKNINE